FGHAAVFLRIDLAAQDDDAAIGDIDGNACTRLEQRRAREDFLQVSRAEVVHDVGQLIRIQLGDVLDVLAHAEGGEAGAGGGAGTADATHAADAGQAAGGGAGRGGGVDGLPEGTRFRAGGSRRGVDQAARVGNEAGRHDAVVVGSEGIGGAGYRGAGSAGRG